MPNLSNTKLNAEIIKQQLSKNNAGVKNKTHISQPYTKDHSILEPYNK